MKREPARTVQSEWRSTRRPSSKRSQRFLFLISALALLAACDRQEQTPAEPTTTVHEVLSGRVQAGTRVVLRGSVTQLRPVPAAGLTSFRLTSNGDSISVLTHKGAPVLGSTVTTSGVVRT